jgi:predicted anti-sigma-YlaC factor YlaD
MMTCEELMSYLSDYIDNHLDEELRSDAEEHLRTCHNCRVVLDSTRKTISLFKESGQLKFPAVRRDALFARVQKAFLERGESPPESKD